MSFGKCSRPWDMPPALPFLLPAEGTPAAATAAFVPCPFTLGSSRCNETAFMSASDGGVLLKARNYTSNEQLADEYKGIF